MADISQVEDGMASLDVSAKENLFDKIKKSGSTSSTDKMKEIFRYFDKDK